MPFTFNSAQKVNYFELDSSSVSGSAMLVEEVPLAITINEITHAVMMVTPVNLDVFVLGFMLSEGIINHASEMRDLDLQHIENNTAYSNISSLSINVALSPRKLAQFKKTKKARLGATGCGLCGVESIDHALPEIGSLPKSAPIDHHILLNLRETLFSHQTLGKETGAIHAALLLSVRGEPIICMEDIGRHNALDKIIGYALTHDINLHSHSVLMSSRCSTELIQKAVRAGLSRLIHLASPSTLAVALAKQANLTLIHLPKKDAPRTFSSSE